MTLPTPEAAAHRHHPQPPPEGLLHAFQSLGYIVIVAVFIITFIAQPFRIPSASMEPTLLIGDFLLVAKHNFPSRDHTPLLPPATLHRGDVIVFHYPLDPSLHLVKRIIGLPGDHLRLRNGRVFIDGRLLDEPYARYQPGPADNFRDNFPRLQSPDPDVNSNWWIQMKQARRPRRAHRPPRPVLRPRRQPQRQRGQPLLGLRPRLRHRRPPPAHLLLPRRTRIRRPADADRRTRRPPPHPHPPRPFQPPQRPRHPPPPHPLRPLGPHPPHRPLTRPDSPTPQQAIH